ncbi:MAG: glycosyltransferase [Cypionkella sp.]|uniref:glycosyltransferase n=1 Tax=Cypionkella sp. TaxID=2811411 RepID=UPI0026103CD7|nr:hypothetical protein [Cypionkella sp.]MDB5659945.1 glycosyltransferase [Cypionkella sp.]
MRSAVVAIPDFCAHMLPEPSSWGTLGVKERILKACASRNKIFNSIYALALRIPLQINRCFENFLAASEWQLQRIAARHPDALCETMPNEPRFASDQAFFPTGAAKAYYVVHVADTLPFKRHDILLDALAKLPRRRALRVVGSGHLTENLKAEVERSGLSADLVFNSTEATINDLINRARISVACNVEDSAPATLAKYTMAGLPVSANAALVCGRQHIRPTGLTATDADFDSPMGRLIDTAHNYSPRPVVQRLWTWPHSVKRLGALIESARQSKKKVSA